MSDQKVSSRSNIPLAWWKGYLQPLEMLDPRRPPKNSHWAIPNSNKVSTLVASRNGVAQLHPQPLDFQSKLPGVFQTHHLANGAQPHWRISKFGGGTSNQKHKTKTSSRMNIQQSFNNHSTIIQQSSHRFDNKPLSAALPAPPPLAGSHPRANHRRFWAGQEGQESSDAHSTSPVLHLGDPDLYNWDRSSTKKWNSMIFDVKWCKVPEIPQPRRPRRLWIRRHESTKDNLECFPCSPHCTSLLRVRVSNQRGHWPSTTDHHPRYIDVPWR